MKTLTSEEREELEELRRYRQENEGKSLTRAFARLEGLLNSDHDPLMSVRAFRIIGECLVCLKEAVNER